MTNYTITINKDKYTVGQEELDSIDPIPTGPSDYHVLKDNRAFTVAVTKTDFPNKTMTLEVNGNSYDLRIGDEYDELVDKMGLLQTMTHKINSIKAPMPGLILNIMATVGQEVGPGTPLVVLSAMKMENIITSPGEGVVKHIDVAINDAVEKGQIIIEME
ncbi:MAG: biotin attachment protein [Arenibacter sp.]|nr:biotin attachment protein [Arenibacter sp.]